MDLAAKLQLRPGQSIRLVNRPPGLVLDLATTDAPDAGPLLLFVHSQAELADQAQLAVATAHAGRPAWIAYPKAGQLGTDLNRDRVWESLLEHGIRPIRQVSIDDTWTALRFRPA